MSVGEPIQLGEHAEALRQFKRCRLNPTQARLVIWQSLNEAVEPLRMPDLRHAVQQRGLAAPPNTLYRTLREMEDRGLVRRVRVEGESHALYVLMEKGRFNQSLSCADCGSSHWVDDVAVQASIEALCQRLGLALEHYRLEVHAHCDACLREESPQDVARLREG